MTTGKATVISQKQLAEVFAWIQNENLPYSYQQANCHNVSHYIYLLLQTKGIICSKIWSFSPGIYSNTNSSLITFVDPKKLSPTGKIDWGYHVAPLFHVQKGKKIIQMVIDLGLFPNGPVAYKTWLNKLKTRKLLYLIMDAHWYLFTSSMIPNYVLYGNSDYVLEQNVNLPYFFWDKLINDFFEYEADAYYELWLPKGLAINQTAIAFYEEEIAPILKQKSKKELVNDYKNLVGNVFNFETVFRDNMWNFDVPPEFQEKHQDVIFKYKQIYDTNLWRWNDLVNQKIKL
ncbi:MAG: hypothetical protein QG594_1532 [Bacteroidota bacterium]|nr:hypothetical protein [Bacteroidota bacterium]